MFDVPPPESEVSQLAGVKYCQTKTATVSQLRSVGRAPAPSEWVEILTAAELG